MDVSLETRYTWEEVYTIKEGNRTMKTVKDRMLHLMDDLLLVVHRIATDENAKPEEIAALPALANSIVRITAYAVIEKKG